MNIRYPNIFFLKDKVHIAAQLSQKYFIGVHFFQYTGDGFIKKPDTNNLDANTYSAEHIVRKGDSIYSSSLSGTEPLRKFLKVLDHEGNFIRELTLDVSEMPYPIVQDLKMRLLNMVYTPDDKIVGSMLGPDDVTYIGQFKYTILTKFDFDGKLIWATKLQHPDYEQTGVRNVTQFADGRFWVRGPLEDSVKKDSYYIAELGPDGDLHWLKQFDFAFLEGDVFDNFVQCAESKLYALTTKRMIYDEDKQKRLPHDFVYFLDSTTAVVDSCFITKDKEDINGLHRNTMVLAENGNNVVILGWNSFSQLYMVEIEPDIMSSVEDIQQYSFKISPNPTTEVISFSLENNSGYDLQIIDLLGNTVLNKNYASGGENELDVSMLAGGTYFAVVVLPDGTKYRSKFVKK
jgi:Secretion system C-terminal sorting domain